MSLDYRTRLVGAYPCITEIWLFGSRANGTAREDSDWDYLVFTDDDRLLNLLCQDTQFNDPDIDLLVAVVMPNIKKAIKPWAGDWQKMLDLGNGPGHLNWQKLSATEASYNATKKSNPSDPTDKSTDFLVARAELVYRRDPWPL